MEDSRQLFHIIAAPILFMVNVIVIAHDVDVNPDDVVFSLFGAGVHQALNFLGLFVKDCQIVFRLYLRHAVEIGWGHDTDWFRPDRRREGNGSIFRAQQLLCVPHIFLLMDIGT